MRGWTYRLAGWLAAAMLAGSTALAGPLAHAAMHRGAASRALSAGAVASPDIYGALAAQQVLKQGGNAVDAAVATAFALAVTYPEAGNLGGGGFMTVYMDGKPYFLDYRETAPAAASAGMYLTASGEPDPRASLVGNLASGVPGTVRGLAEAHRRFGKLSWKQDLTPAIAYARDGFMVTPQLIGIIDGAKAERDGTNFAAWATQLKAGLKFRQPDLAATLQRIADQGPDGFYKGPTADRIVAQMARGPVKGLITHADLEGYKAAWREPVQGDWHGFTLITAPPPSSGGIALLQMLNMKADAAPLFQGQALNSAQYVHLVAEIEKRVFADRAVYLGDPDSVKVPVAALTDPAYVARRAREIDPAKPSATDAVQPGLEKPQTTHFSVVDRWGNAVSNTYTLNGWFGSGVVVEGAGFLLNDEMDDFSAKPGAPNQYGVIGGSANAIAPGKRPLSSMTPTILLKDGRVAMVIGTPGGSRIFTSVFQVLVNAYDFHLPLKAAVDAPRYHHQLLPVNTIYAEPYGPWPAPLAAQLKARGYTLVDQDYNGDIEAIEVNGRTPVVAPDPRARGAGLVVP
ncbi:gamma-glutamyltransferase [Caulobacter sp. KR2-114]|uniref:gamma-glutamyltransferase n=1 Tax=Caulobacter sp. KR2-114 TaxID=3400912 RepID=UPI003BFDF7F4